MREASAAAGYADCVLNPRTDQSALENSIKAVYGMKNKAVVSRKQPRRNGVELVNIERDAVRNGYVTNFGAKVVNGRVKADYGFANEFALTEESLRQKAKLTSTVVGQALVAVLAKMDGMTGLKPRVFYIPEHPRTLDPRPVWRRSHRPAALRVATAEAGGITTAAAGGNPWPPGRWDRLGRGRSGIVGRRPAAGRQARAADRSTQWSTPWTTPPRGPPSLRDSDQPPRSRAQNVTSSIHLSPNPKNRLSK